MQGEYRCQLDDDILLRSWCDPFSSPPPPFAPPLNRYFHLALFRSCKTHVSADNVTGRAEGIRARGGLRARGKEKKGGNPRFSSCTRFQSLPADATCTEDPRLDRSQTDYTVSRGQHSRSQRRESAPLSSLGIRAASISQYKSCANRLSRSSFEIISLEIGDSLNNQDFTHLTNQF